MYKAEIENKKLTRVLEVLAVAFKLHENEFSHKLDEPWKQKVEFILKPQLNSAPDKWDSEKTNPSQNNLQAEVPAQNIMSNQAYNASVNN